MNPGAFRRRRFYCHAPVLLVETGRAALGAVGQIIRDRPLGGVIMKAYSQLGLRSCYQGSLAAARRLV